MTQCQFDYQLAHSTRTYTRQYPRFALGGIRKHCPLISNGYQFFDCVLPTRDARHQRLYIFQTDPQALDLANIKKLATNHQLDKIFDYLYIGRSKYQTAFQQISEHCDCPICQNQQISRAYLYHLFKVKDSSAWRLATLHNLRTYKLLMEALSR